MSNTLKYAPELYVDSGFYGVDMDDTFIQESEKLVKCRKDHKCINCQSEIHKGDYALREVALFPGEGNLHIRVQNVSKSGLKNHIRLENK